ncbi:MAG: acetate--CoA ligase [Nitrospirota bacterium]
MDPDSITSVLNERRLFKPNQDFSSQAAIKSRAEYDRLCKKADKNPEGFWAELAKELTWAKPWKKVLSWKLPDAKWFVGGKINVSTNCLDRHLDTFRKNKAAIIWEGEPGDSRTLTYHDLHREVCKFANVLKGQGIVKGDRVAIYLPMIPELPIAMLACARIGATHSVIFGGFSASALKDRINDAGSKLVVTADGGFRKGAVVTLKEKVDEALKETPSVCATVVVKRTNTEVIMKEGRDFWWHDLMKGASDKCPPAALDSEHPLFTLYTSGTTGKPKGVVHSTGGYLLGAMMTARWIFDLKETDTYWCTADIGWVTGHSYMLYGILANGVTSVMYEGVPTYPQPDRLWEIIEKHHINIFYTAPTAIRALIKLGKEWPLRHDLSSLRLLGTVGEPINPEAWMWYHEVIGKKKCPIVDTWWQTETGSIMISPLPGAIATKPGSATLPFPGISADVVDRNGKSVPANTGGYLVIKKPWPSMLRGVWGDPERYKKQYWSDIPGFYFTGDGARRDKDGYFWIMGRVDDVINVAGHRLGTMEIESALVSHKTVAEAAVVGRPDEIKGTGIVAFVTLELGNDPSDKLKDALKAHVSKEIGQIARPDEIRFAENLPKTRSGKIMRRLLRDIAAGRETAGDTTTLEDYTVLAKLRQDED